MTIWKAVANGGALGGGAPLAVQDEGSSVDASVVQINFVGSGVTASQTSPGQVQVAINTAAALSLRKLVYNNTGGVIPAFSALSWAADGSVQLADANIPSKSLFAGISENAISNTSYGFSIKGGNILNAVATLGLTPGQQVFLGENPGELTATPPIGLGDTIFKVGRAEPPDGVFQSNATDLWLEAEIIAAP